MDKFLFVLERLHTRELAAWEITAIKDWWKSHAAHVHIHHKIEVGPMADIDGGQGEISGASLQTRKRLSVAVAHHAILHI